MSRGCRNVDPTSKREAVLLPCTNFGEIIGSLDKVRVSQHKVKLPWVFDLVGLELELEMGSHCAHCLHSAMWSAYQTTDERFTRVTNSKHVQNELEMRSGLALKKTLSTERCR